MDLVTGEDPAAERATAKELLGAATRITVLTGAGLSTASGIPDFRGPAGLWTADPEAERISTLDWYLYDEGVRRAAWRYRAASSVWQARPNAAHRALARLEDQGRLRAIITQNTDGLHQQAGSRAVLEMHGNVHTWRCETCRAEGPMAEAVARVRAGDPDPRCPSCGGVIRATTILFGENLDQRVLTAAYAAAEDCDLLLAVGTSLTVHPVAGLVSVAGSAGARIVIVNGEPTPYDRRADAVVREPIETILPRLIGA
ncbi:Sir2 family NAD-dependent protein deacetylase [Raineyella sp. W15-4]|uniref:SIR2 family NAD-dependent protein deacylase n=1 Tax=Raineyella sp. W15-4 TaxID=3081651 RepID=UPI002952E197|nr:Sir2 family NAD-dependent protein deacetylase [Raineyella sp. W15-4]WOQ17009.1 Sir2 family NAD-dependent protein deacetylase [Raineyella sp. W15-4]